MDALKKKVRGRGGGGGGTEKRGGEATISKKKGQAKSRNGCLKKRGGMLEPPLRNYGVYIYIVAGK